MGREAGEAEVSEEGERSVYRIRQTEREDKVKGR